MMKVEIKQTQPSKSYHETIFEMEFAEHEIPSVLPIIDTFLALKGTKPCEHGKLLHCEQCSVPVSTGCPDEAHSGAECGHAQS